MVAAVASHPVKVDPETVGWWISLAYALRRAESVEKAEAILLRGRRSHGGWCTASPSAIPKRKRYIPTWP